MDSLRPEKGGATVGKRDSQTVIAGGAHSSLPRIAGVKVMELGNVLTRSGSLLEVFRQDWRGIDMVPQQVLWAQLNANGVTDWHKHDRQTDHLVAVGGNIRLALWDDRPGSPTRGQHEIIRLGALRPVMVIVPPGVWHALRNESGAPAGYINVVDEMFDYEKPDNYRLPADSTEAPDIL
ncbi:MAG: dTDP-4-dehydrorhamnose 3,5-epimerase family protein [Alphaproteobacteria bacterium]|nr:dTDP-4-dehydrorhamnose 3,5-epimerase family protein [Alphaproteobacteria bacterium]